MSFTSIEFLLFIGITFIIYYIFPFSKRWVVLLIASYTFYGFADVRFLPFLLFTTCSTYLTGRMLELENNRIAEITALDDTNDGQAKRVLLKKKKKKLLMIGLMTNLFILIVVKYFNDMLQNLNLVVRYLDLDYRLQPLSLLVPLGISYYIFQSIGYLMDIYRTKYPAEKNIFRYALFISFFPQLIQGPITRYNEISVSLYRGHAFCAHQIVKGFLLILWGYFLKMVIADRIGLLIDPIFKEYPSYLGGYVILAGVGYSLQVYTDFSGGINIARGVAELFGITLPENFQQPFFAMSLQDYWRRWHISLNNWLRDYVFYPISLSKTFVKLGKYFRNILGVRFGKNMAIYIATFVVRIIMAIWHGASWKYLFQGLFHGFLITAGIQFKPELEKLTKLFHINTECFSWKLFRLTRTFLLVSAARLMIRTETLKDAFYMLGSVFTKINPWIWVDGSILNLGLSSANVALLIVSLLILLFVSLLREQSVDIRECILNQNIIFRWILYYLLIFSILIFGIYGPGYDAASFIYQKF